MKLFFSAHKATRRFLNSQQYHFHGGSRPRFYHVSNCSIWWSKSCQIKPSSWYSVHRYSTANSLLNENHIEKLDLEIISRETIKPKSPTPQRLRTFNLSIIDQVIYDCYIPLILFLPNTDKAGVTDVITKRSKHLKETLSEILTRFYPFAGEINGNVQIECNDKGAYYVEARVNQTLEDFLCRPDDQKVRELMPDSPRTSESSIGNYIIGVQVNVFKCGGIGLCTSMTHKLVDGHTYIVFMKAWAEASRGSKETISPSFMASEVFPNNPCLEDVAPSTLMSTKLLSTKRFVFDSTALAVLKAQPGASSPSRMEATTALIWKTAAKAVSTVRPFGPQSPHYLLSPVNIRKKASPLFPNDSVGNIVGLSFAICFPESQLHLPTLMHDLRESIAKINSDVIESKKGKKGHVIYNEMLRSLNQLSDVTQEGDLMFATSLLNSGVYELDFGWGKPIWFCFINPGMARIVALNDTVKGGGVEASVTLSPEEMEIFERDPELLSYVSVDPNPLQFLNL